MSGVGAGSPSARGVCTAVIGNTGRKQVSPSVKSGIQEGRSEADVASEQPLAGGWTGICERSFNRGQEVWSLGSGEASPPSP